MLKKLSFFLLLFSFANSLYSADPELKPRLGDIPDNNPVQKKEKHNTKSDRRPLDQRDPTIEENYQLVHDVTEEFYQKGLKALNSGDLTTAEGYFDRVLVIKPNHKGAKQGIAQIMKKYDQLTPKETAPKISPKDQLINKLTIKLDTKIAEENFEGASAVVTEILAIDPENSSVRKKSILINKKLYAIALTRAREREEAGDERGAIDAYLLAMNYGKDSELRTKISQLQERLIEKNKTKSASFYIQALEATQSGQNDKAISLCRKALELDPKNLQAQRMLERIYPQAPELKH